MKQYILSLALLLPCVVYSQAGRERRIDVYSRILNLLPTSSHATLVTIDDYYFDIRPKGSAGIVIYPDSLIHSSYFREVIFEKGTKENCFDTVVFCQFQNFDYTNLAAKNQIILREGKPFSFYYIHSPISDEEYFNFLFSDTDQFNIIVPVEEFEFDGMMIRSKTLFFRVSAKEKRILKSKDFRIKQIG